MKHTYMNYNKRHVDCRYISMYMKMQHTRGDVQPHGNSDEFNRFALPFISKQHPQSVRNIHL